MCNNILILLQEWMQDRVVWHGNQHVEMSQIPLPISNLVEECLPLRVYVFVSLDHEVLLDAFEQCDQVDVVSIETVG